MEGGAGRSCEGGVEADEDRGDADEGGGEGGGKEEDRWGAEEGDEG